MNTYEKSQMLKAIDKCREKYLGLPTSMKSNTSCIIHYLSKYNRNNCNNVIKLADSANVKCFSTKIL